MTGFSRWLARERAKVFKAWNDNQISLVEAARRLYQLGYTPDQAFEELQR